KRVEVLRRVKDLQRFVEAMPGVTSTVSIVDYLELISSRPGEGDICLDDNGQPVTCKNPLEDQHALDELLKSIGQYQSVVKSAVTPDFATASIMVRTRLSGSRTIQATLDGIRRYVDEHFPKDLPVRLTGTLVLLTGTTSDILTGQIESLAIALGV